MTTIAQVRADLALLLNTNLTGWRASAYIGDQLNPPHIKVGMPPFDPRFILSGSKATYRFRCLAYYTRAAGDAGEKALDALCELTGSGSLIAAVQTSANWSVSIDYAQVVNVGEVSVTQFGTDAAEYFVRPFDVEVVW